MNIQEIRQEIRTWLAANWDPNLDLIQWRELLADSGWAHQTGLGTILAGT